MSIEKGKSSKKTVENKSIRTSMDAIFAPWLCKKWRTVAHGYSFNLTITDSISKSKASDSKEMSVELFTLNPDDSSIQIRNEAIVDWANSSKPIIILYHKDGSCGYLALSEHYLNTLFSENPSRSAQDLLTISLSQFSALQKNKINEIRRFLFSWKKMNFAVLESGSYFDFKDSLKSQVDTTLRDVSSLNIDLNLDVLTDISEDINRAIYTVAIVGPTKAGKSTIINSLVSKHVSPINIRPTTGIPTSIVPGRTEKTEVLLNTGQVITGAADVSFLNQFVAIDENRSNHKGVKMVTVWVQSSQMEKGLSFCDFPGLDDPDPEIERTVQKSLEFVNAIIYVIDASGMEKGFKFPRQYRDDLNSLKHKDKIFLVINKIDDFDDPTLLNDFKMFIDEHLNLLGLKELLPYPPIYMSAKKTFENRQKGIYEKDEMVILESQVWDHLLANSKSGLNNLMNIIGQISVESERLSRALNARMLNGKRKAELRQALDNTEHELNKIRSFGSEKRNQITRWLLETLTNEKNHLISYFRSELQLVPLGNELPSNLEIRNYLMEQFAITAPEIFELLENEITLLHNDLNSWVSQKLQSVEITIDKYTKQHFRSSDSFNQVLLPISNIFSESYGQDVPRGMVGNILYHVFNTFNNVFDWIAELLTDKKVVRNRKIDAVLRKVEKCYDEIFEKLFNVFDLHQKEKCKLLLDKVKDRTDIYIANLKDQMSELNNPLSPSEKHIYQQAIDRLVQLGNDSEAIRIQIDDYSVLLKPKPSPEEIKKELDSVIDQIEKGLRNTINTVLVKAIGTTEAKKLVLPHLQQKLKERVEKELRDHPGTTDVKYTTLESQLPFFDMSEYNGMISSTAYWEYFKGIFNSKDNLTKHFNQLSTLRNTIRHSRPMTDLIMAEGNASILWFKMALKLS